MVCAKSLRSALRRQLAQFTGEIDNDCLASIDHRTTYLRVGWLKILSAWRLDLDQRFSACLRAAAANWRLAIELCCISVHGVVMVGDLRSGNVGCFDVLMLVMPVEKCGGGERNSMLCET